MFEEENNAKTCKVGATKKCKKVDQYNRFQQIGKPSLRSQAHLP